MAKAAASNNPSFDIDTSADGRAIVVPAVVIVNPALTLKGEECDKSSISGRAGKEDGFSSSPSTATNFVPQPHDQHHPFADDQVRRKRPPFPARRGSRSRSSTPATTQMGVKRQ